MLKKQKERLQICLSQDQVRYLDQWAQILGDCKNYSEVISKVLFDHEAKTRAIENITQKAKEAAQKKPYEEVRTDQFKTNHATSLDQRGFNFLKQYQHAPIDNSKSKIKFTKVKVVD